MKFINRLFILLLIGSFYMCEEPFTPEQVNTEPRYVVEGHVEIGEIHKITPPYVFLTYSLPFHTDINRNTIEELFIHDAQVLVWKESDTVQLREYCLSDLSPTIREKLLKNLEIMTYDSITPEMCVYMDLGRKLDFQEGDVVHLRIVVEGDTLRSMTRFPYAVGLDSFKFREPLNSDITMYRELIAYITDPAEFKNYYRYKVSVNSSSFYPGSVSVVEDKLFNGKSIDFPIVNPIQVRKDIKQDLLGLYAEGNEVIIKWMSIDKAHFDFWNSLEYAQSSQGPFSSYTRVKSNVDGALGIFGAYTSRFYDLYVPVD